MSFSQRGEDEQFVLPYFGDRIGRFLDIGAADGKTLSNTHALALKGWRGVCVEPSPWGVAALLQLYHDRRDIEVWSCAVVARQAKVGFQVFHATQDLVGSLDAEHARLWNENQGVPYRDLMVMTIHPQALPAGHYDFVNIDVEGDNLAVMQACPWDKWRPDMVCVEHDNRLVEIKAIGESMGLRIMGQTEENLVLAR